MKDWLCKTCSRYMRIGTGPTENNYIAYKYYCGFTLTWMKERVVECTMYTESKDV